MHDLFTVESFDLEKTYEYILSIQVSLSGFSFLVKSPNENKFLAYKNISVKISNNSVLSRHFNEWLKTEELLHKPFKKVRVIVLNEYFSLVPEVYFQNSVKNFVSKYLFEENTEFELAENIIHSLKSKLIFALPSGLNALIQNLIGVCEIVHPVKLILNNLPEISKVNGLVLFFESKNFYTVLFNHQTIVMVNSFKMLHSNDVLYYVHTLLKQLAISTKQTTLFISYSAAQTSNFEVSLKSSFSDIQHLDPVFDFSNKQQTVPFTLNCNS